MRTEKQTHDTPPDGGGRGQDADGVPEIGLIDSHVLRWAAFVFGIVCVGTGVVGIFVPGLPTTVFLIMALWAFSKSSERFHDWLWTHPRFGRPVRDWYRHRVIPVKAKILAVTVMAASFVYVAGFVAEDWRLPAVMAAVLVPVATYIVTRRSRPPSSMP